MKRPLPPKSIVTLVKLWPHARKHGYEIGQVWRVGYYTPDDGLDVVWLVDFDGNYKETADHDWLEKHFKVSFRSKEKSFYGAKRIPLGPMNERGQ